MKYLFLIPAAMILSGCASIVSGTSQNIAFTVNPTTAQCDLTTKQGQKVAVVTAQNNVVHVAKSSDDMTLACAAKGFSPKVATIASKVNPGAAMVMGLADIGSGAIYKYPEQVTIQLEKQ